MKELFEKRAIINIEMRTNISVDGMFEGKDLLYDYLKAKFGMVDVSIFDRILSANYKEHQPSIIRSATETKEFAIKLKESFPNQSFKVEDEVIKDGKVVFRYKWHAVQTGKFMDWIATNKDIATQGIIIAKVSDGRIDELWEEWDFAGFLRQINR